MRVRVRFGVGVGARVRARVRLGLGSGLGLDAAHLERPASRQRLEVPIALHAVVYRLLHELTHPSVVVAQVEGYDGAQVVAGRGHVGTIGPAARARQRHLVRVRGRVRARASVSGSSVGLEPLQGKG